MEKDKTYIQYQKGSDELVEALVEAHMGWAQAIARSVARAWNLDWQLDGLDGGAYEGLLFCARRYDPEIGVPFRAYARRRIHEASTEEARKSKSWQRGVGANSEEEQAARELSVHLFRIFPELREGLLPPGEADGEDAARTSIRKLLTCAGLLHTFQETSPNHPEQVMEHKRMLQVIADLETVHQSILWAIYWKGQSMRSLADEWEIDELAVIREHKEILKYVFSNLAEAKPGSKKKLKIRPGLRPVAQAMRRDNISAPFEGIRTSSPAALAVCLALADIFGLVI